jgi:branched-chain amino acid transport system permease protein
MTTAVRPARPSVPNPFAGMDDRRRQMVIIAGLVVLAIVYPIVYRPLSQALPFLPWPGTAVLIYCATFAILALGLNIVMGFAGLLDLGYVAFYAIGAYTTAFLASGHFGIHISWWIVVWIAVGVAAVFGVMLGAPTLKLRGDYLAIVTLGFGEIVRLVFRNLGDITIILPSFLGGAVILGPNANLTGGNVGINPIDPPTIPISGPWGNAIIFSNQNAIASWYLVLVLMALTFFVCRRLRDSKLGRAWMAIREDETAAAAMGINTVSGKLLAFSLGASFSGFAGAFTGSYQTAIFAETFNFNVSILVVIMIILGGIGSLRGVIIGAFAVAYVDRTLLPFLGGYIDTPIQNLGSATGIELLRDFKLTTYNYLLFGITLAVMMIKRPEGLFPDESAKAEMHGIGIAAEVTAAAGDELAAAEEVALEEVQLEDEPLPDPNAPPPAMEVPPPDPSVGDGPNAPPPTGTSDSGSETSA